MRYLITLLLFFVLWSSASTQNIFTKDGKNLGPRESFITSCTDGQKEKIVNIKGMNVNVKSYCSCICDNLMPTLNYSEIDNAVRNDQLTELFLQDDNFNIVLKCLEGNYKIDDEYQFDKENQTDISRELSQKLCVKEILESDDIDEKWTKEMAEEYCQCAIEKLYSKGYKYKDLQEIANQDSESFNEIAVPCVTQVYGNHPDVANSNSYVPADITGDAPSSEISLVDYLGKGFKLKISIHGISKYFLFDTGASDLIINQDFERELLIEGHLKKEDYLGTETYQMANNKNVEAQLVQLNNVQIGNYSVDNVIAAVLKEGSLLCGKGFLDKFKKWEVDKEQKILILYK